METQNDTSSSLPFSIVWAPIPLVSWLLPFVGHVGVTRSDGTILDFAGGPRGVNVGAFAFGRPARWLALQPERASILRSQSWRQQAGGGAAAGGSAAAGRRPPALGPDPAAFWDEWLDFAASLFIQRHYNILTNNCHEFACCFLNSVRYDDAHVGRWTAVRLGAALTLCGQPASAAARLKTWLPFAAVTAAGVYLWGSAYLLGWAAAAALVVAWYWAYGAFIRPDSQGIVSLG